MGIENEFPASARALALRETQPGAPLVRGLSLIIAIIIVVILLVFSSTRAITDANARVEHARDVVGELDETARVITDLQCADSRYLLTGAAGDRSARDGDADAMVRHLGTLAVLLANDPVQTARLGAMDPYVQKLLGSLRTSGSESVAAHSTEIESLCQQISADTDAIRDDQNLRLSQDRAELGRRIKVQSAAFLGLLLLASSALCLACILISGHMKQREHAILLLESARRRVAADSSPQTIAQARARFDFRSRLTAILGYCDLPLEAGTSLQDRIDLIREETARVVRAVNDILSLPDFADAPAPASTARSAESLATIAQSADRSSNGSPPATRFAGRILLVEDNPSIQAVIEFYLAQAGAQVTTVSDGRTACGEALAAWKLGTPFDLILMDVHMPDFDGVAATIQLREAKYPHPVVALTATATESERRRCLAAGCDGFLTKPLVREEFLKTLERHLARVPGHGAVASPEESTCIDPRLASLRESFEREIPARIAEIAIAVSIGDLTRVADLTHQLKGTAGCFGLSTICHCAAALETAAETREPQAIRQSFQALCESSAQPASIQAA